MSCTLEEWKDLVAANSIDHEFICEDGSGKTYGEVGDWTAAVGPDMQADVVGCYSPSNGFAWYMRAGEVVEC